MQGNWKMSQRAYNVDATFLRRRLPIVVNPKMKQINKKKKKKTDPNQTLYSVSSAELAQKVVYKVQVWTNPFLKMKYLWESFYNR